MNEFFLQTSILFVLIVAIALIVRLLKQPLLIAYIVAGIIGGPIFLNVIHRDQEAFQTFAEFGVVLLLFVIGLSLRVEEIKKIGKTSILAGTVQVLFTANIGFGLLVLLGVPFISAMYISIAITFSSTIIILKLLSDKKDTEKTYARYTIGLMLVQDLIALLVLIGLSFFEQNNAGTNAIIFLLVKGLIIVSIAYLLAKFVLPPLIKRIAQSQEFLFIFALAWCLGVATIINLAGFSLELGAIIAGLMLASTPYQQEIASRIKPIKDFFIIIFFLILGSSMGLGNAEMPLVPGIVIGLFILIGNPIILYFIFRSMKFTRKNSFLIGITAAQVSEFGFILLFSGQKSGLLQGEEIRIFTVIALITIFTSTYLITHAEKLYQLFLPLFNLFGKDKYQQDEKTVPVYDVWVFGYHRIGWKICDTLKKQKMSFAVVDFNPDAIEKLQRRKIPHMFGDADDIEFLESLHLDKAKLVISTLSEPGAQQSLINNVRRRNKKVPIIATLYHTNLLSTFYNEGVSYVELPHLRTGEAISDIIRKKRWSKGELSKLKAKQKKSLKLQYTREPRTS